jgi:hypothetical protein
MKFIYVLLTFPPSYAKQLNVDIIDAIEKHIILYKQKGDIMLCGDLNARISYEVDFILNDSPRYLPLFDSYKPDEKIKLRKSHDDVLDERGKELSDLCITYQMRIVNGRCIGDLLGNFTSFNTQGQSTMDYLMTNERLLNQLLCFKVSDFLPLHSDCHCKIS